MIVEGIVVVILGVYVVGYIVGGDGFVLSIVLLVNGFILGVVEM